MGNEPTQPRRATNRYADKYNGPKCQIHAIRKFSPFRDESGNEKGGVVYLSWWDVVLQKYVKRTIIVSSLRIQQYAQELNVPLIRL